VAVKKKAGVDYALYEIAKQAGLTCKAKGKGKTVFASAKDGTEIEVVHVGNEIKSYSGRFRIDDGTMVKASVVMPAGITLYDVPKVFSNIAVVPASDNVIKTPEKAPASVSAERGDAEDTSGQACQDAAREAIVGEKIPEKPLGVIGLTPEQRAECIEAVKKHHRGIEDRRSVEHQDERWYAHMDPDHRPNLSKESEVVRFASAYLWAKLLRKQSDLMTFFKSLRRIPNAPEGTPEALQGESPWDGCRSLDMACSTLRAVFEELERAKPEEKADVEGRIEAFLAGPTLAALERLAAGKPVNLLTPPGGDGLVRKIVHGPGDLLDVGRVEVYTDGACEPNPGPGGWAFVVVREGVVLFEAAGREERTTNNRMEMFAAISALEWIPHGPKLIVYTDAKYLRNGITSWVHKWMGNGWRTSGGSPVQNKDLWERLYALSSERAVRWEWVRGHEGNPCNELADRLATGRQVPVSAQV